MSGQVFFPKSGFTFFSHFSQAFFFIYFNSICNTESSIYDGVVQDYSRVVVLTDFHFHIFDFSPICFLSHACRLVWH